MPPASPPSSSGSRRRTNVSQACINCRQRKKKCDGVTPTCGTCVTYKDDCVWTMKTDWRKNVSRSEANALRARVAELEAMLQGAAGGNVGGGGGNGNSDGFGGRDSRRQTPYDRPPDRHVHSGHDMSPPVSLRWSANVDSPVRPPSQPPGSYSTHQTQDGFTSGPSTGPSFHPGSSSASSRMGNAGPSGPSMSAASASRSAAPAGPSPTVEVSSYDAGHDSDDLEGFMVQDHRGRLRVHGPSSAYRHDTASEPTAVTSPRDPTRGRRPYTHDDKAFMRFLPDFYLTREQHDTALTRFFRYFASWAQRATPHLFYRDMDIALWTENEADLPVVAPNYSPLLHNMCLALGLAFSDEEHLRALSTRRVFANEGAKHIDRECANPCVATVQALAIRSSFASTMGDYSLGWVNHGLANRLCYALGLHVNTLPLVSRGKLNPEAMVQRNVTFWSCYCQEGMWGIYIGRKPMMQDNSLPLPTTDQETDEIMWKWPPGPRESLPPQKSYLSLAFVHTASLMQIATEVTRTVHMGRADKSSLVESGTVQRFSDTLDGWLDGLPAPLVVNPSASDPVLPHILMIHLAWAWIVILLYQPFSQVVSRANGGISGSYQSNMGIIAMTRCHSAAVKIVQLATLWKDQHTLRFTPPTMTAIIYSAATSFLLAAAQAANPTQAAVSLQKVHMCLDFLEQIGQTWVAGRQQAAILQDMVSECARASMELPSFMGDLRRGWTRRDSDSQASAQPAQNQDQDQQAAAEPATFHPMSWSDDDNFDQFIASLLNQSTVPIAQQNFSLPLEGLM